ncbi:unnamed protein product [Arabidopsis arenosa]|uniref:DUF3444 domain-containing protein n=1 Tax=Arabidopsis arenosa TaxID=38785 RepID=A0A8S2A1D4_ARAAE|nr:unnamed protein product [Arabidopsis arenosa]
MEPEFSPSSRVDTPEQDPSPAQTEDQSRERVSAYDLVVDEGDLEGLDQKKEEMHKVLDQIQEKASSVLEYSLKWDEIYEQFDLLKQQAMELELKEVSLKNQILEMEKKEERLKLVEERARKIEIESDVKQFLEENVARLLVLLMQNEEMVVASLSAKEKFLGLLQGWMMKKHEGVKRELEAREKEVALLSQSIDDKTSDLEKKVKDFDLKQIAETERRRKEAEMMEISHKQFETREKELSLLNETIKEKSIELENKEVVQQAEARETELKNKFLELKERKLEEREKELELKQREIKEGSIQAEARKRSRLESESSLLDRDAESRIRPGKKHIPNKEHNHYDEAKKKDWAFVVPAFTSSPVQISEEDEGEIEEVISIDCIDDDHEPLMCVDSEFHDFSKTMSSFMAGQIWALYDGIDSMPRLYGRIRKITMAQSSLQMTWFESKDEESVPAACGRFKLGNTETIKNHLTFSHQMHPIIHDRHFIAVIPRKGETWALFRDWSKSWNNNPEKHKPPYRYDFVEVVVNFDDCLGIGVAYLGKVDGFVSVYKQAVKHGVVSLMVTPEEMQRFSHRVPSFRLNGNEKEGVPAGSFELDPAAIPSCTLKRHHSIRKEAEETGRQSEGCGKSKTGEVEDQEGVSAYDLMVVEGDLEGVDKKMEKLRKIFEQIQKKASSVLEFSPWWEEIDEELDLLKQRAMEVDLKEVSLKNQILELDKKEERLKLVEERARKMEASIIERLSALEDKENDSDVKQFLEENVARLVLEMQNEEMVVAQRNAQEKLLQGSMKLKHEELMREVEARREEVALLSKSIDDKTCDLEIRVKAFDLKQTTEFERMRKETELIETSLKQLEARENELRLLNETIQAKSNVLEKKEENFQLKQQAQARDMEVKIKFLELKEKELGEREKELELKQREVQERSIQAGSRKRSRVESGPSLDAESLTQHNQNDEENDFSASVVSTSTSSPLQKSDAHEEVVVSIVRGTHHNDEAHEPLMCVVDSEFNDFSKTMSSFMAGQVWALYDGIDSMPRCYGRIKKVNKCQSSLQVTWLEPKDEESVLAACGRFKWGNTETIKSHLAFSHEIHPIIRGKHFIAVNPSKGETWALFRDWSKSWNNNPKQHKPPYRYDFVEVLVNYDDCLGVGVAYLGKVQGFASVYKQAGQHGVISFMITPEEMQRFSHRVPSFRLNGEEKEGVPDGSFELDPAAIPSSILKRDRSIRKEAEETEKQSEDCGKTGENEDKDGSRKDFPIILD